MNTDTMKNDIADKELIDMKQISKILGLKYHTARKVIFQSKLGFVEYGKRKRLWIKEDILNFKRSCYSNPEIA